jgi:hypothetical protein
MKMTIVTVGLLLATAGAAGAQTGRPVLQPMPEVERHRTIAVTLSPLHLLPIEIEQEDGGTLRLTMLQVMGEYRLARRVGVAGILGGGRGISEDAVGNSIEFTVGEIGAQGLFYLLGHFDSRHALDLGAQVLYLGIDGETDGSIGVAGEGLALGFFLGYKLTTRIGFTFVGQLGVQRLLLSAEADTGEMATDEKTSALLNLHVGWTF